MVHEMATPDTLSAFATAFADCISKEAKKLHSAGEPTVQKWAQWAPTTDGKTALFSLPTLRRHEVWPWLSSTAQ